MRNRFDTFPQNLPMEFIKTLSRDTESVGYSIAGPVFQVALALKVQ